MIDEGVFSLCQRYPAENVAVAAGNAAFLRPESDAGTAICPGGSLNSLDTDTEDLWIEARP